MHGLRWQVMETEITAPSLDPTPIRSAVGRIQPKPRGAIVMWNLKKGLGYEKLYIMQSWEAVKKSVDCFKFKLSTDFLMGKNVAIYYYFFFFDARMTFRIFTSVII